MAASLRTLLTALTGGKTPKPPTAIPTGPDYVPPGKKKPTTPTPIPNVPDARSSGTLLSGSPRKTLLGS